MTTLMQKNKKLILMCWFVNYFDHFVFDEPEEEEEVPDVMDDIDFDVFDLNSYEKKNKFSQNTKIQNCSSLKRWKSVGKKTQQSEGNFYSRRSKPFQRSK